VIAHVARWTKRNESQDSAAAFVRFIERLRIDKPDPKNLKSAIAEEARI